MHAIGHNHQKTDGRGTHAGAHLQDPGAIGDVRDLGGKRGIEALEAHGVGPLKQTLESSSSAVS